MKEGNLDTNAALAACLVFPDGVRMRRSERLLRATSAEHRAWDAAGGKGSIKVQVNLPPVYGRQRARLAHTQREQVARERAWFHGCRQVAVLNLRGSAQVDLDVLWRLGWVQQFEIGREFCHIDQLVAMGMARAFNQRLQLLFVCTVFCKSASRA
jgi:hypothetical protein